MSRKENRKAKKKKITRFINMILFLVLIISIFTGSIYFKFFLKKEIDKEETYIYSEVGSEENDDISGENKENETSETDQIDEISGYKVIGKIIIAKIGLEDVILEKTTDQSLNLGLTKFWGPNLNEAGNVSITGHNYKIKRSPLFSKLNNVKIGDQFEIQDLSGRKVTYKIYEKFTVEPTDTSVIEQNKDGKREVTLITCTKGAKKRIIIKAKETSVN